MQFVTVGGDCGLLFGRLIITVLIARDRTGALQLIGHPPQPSSTARGRRSAPLTRSAAAPLLLESLLPLLGSVQNIQRLAKGADVSASGLTLGFDVLVPHAGVRAPDRGLPLNLRLHPPIGELRAGDYLVQRLATQFSLDARVIRLDDLCLRFQFLDGLLGRVVQLEFRIANEPLDQPLSVLRVFLYRFNSKKRLKWQLITSPLSAVIP